MIEKRWWSLLCKHKPDGFAAIFEKFYANMVGKKEKMCYVRGKSIKEELNKTFNLKEQKD